MNEPETKVLDASDSPFGNIEPGTPSSPPQASANPEPRYSLDDLRMVVGEMMQQYTPPAPPQQMQLPLEPPKKEEDFNELFYTDPRAAFDRMKSEIIGEWEKKEKARQAQIEEQRAWQMFGEKYPELKDFTDIAQSTFARDPNKYAQVRNMKGVDGLYEQLASDVKRRLTIAPARTETDRTVTVDGRVNTPVQAPPAQEPPKPTTLAEQLKARRSARES